MARIVIDYTSAMQQTAGIGRYTRNLVSALADADRIHRYAILTFGEPAPHAGWPSNFEQRSCRLPAHWLTIAWQRLRLPLPAEWLSGDADIFHSPDFTLPPLARARGVVTIHDLSFLRLPECADPGLRVYLESAVPRAASRAQHILADSESTRRDILELLGIPSARISVVHGGVDQRFRRVTDQGTIEAVRHTYRLPPRFILGVGTLEPRKNFARLIAAYARLRRQNPTLQQHLVIAGRRGWLYEEIFAEATRQDVGSFVHFPGYIADSDLPALYSLADLLAFPSLYEGFGLPPLEALACETPVLAADNSSLPETLGPAALLVPATDTPALADGMARLIEDRALCDRLRPLGLAQAQHYSWGAAAQELLAAYGHALA